MLEEIEKERLQSAKIREEKEKIQEMKKSLKKNSNVYKQEIKEKLYEL